MQFPKVILDFGAVTVPNELVRNEKGLGVASIGISNLLDVGTVFVSPICLGADRERPTFGSRLSPDSDIPGKRQIVGDGVGFSVNLAVAASRRASLRQQVGADLFLGQMAREVLKVH